MLYTTNACGDHFLYGVFCPVSSSFAIINKTCSTSIFRFQWLTLQRSGRAAGNCPGVPAVLQAGSQTLLWNRPFKFSKTLSFSKWWPPGFSKLHTLQGTRSSQSPLLWDRDNRVCFPYRRDRFGSGPGPYIPSANSANQFPAHILAEKNGNCARPCFLHTLEREDTSSPCGARASSSIPLVQTMLNPCPHWESFAYLPGFQMSPLHRHREHMPGQ